MAKRLPADQRSNSSVLTFVPAKVREQVEKLADQSKVSISEIGRRAITEYVGKKAGKKGE
jgi:hypothetical protein